MSAALDFTARGMARRVERELAQHDRTFATRIELKAVRPRHGDRVWLDEGNRKGVFVFESWNRTSGVSKDPLEGAFIAPASDPTGASGVWARADRSVIHPEWFGAAGDGWTDDTAAFQAAVNYCNSYGGGVTGDTGSIYALSDTIWFGNADASAAIRFVVGNGAAIYPLAGLAGKPVFDLVGITNGNAFALEGWRYNDADGTVLPSHFLAMGRPKQAAGVVSSGGCRIADNQIYGHFSSAVVRVVSSESNLFSGNRFFNYHASGCAFSITRHDWFNGCGVLHWDGATGPAFAAGQTLTGPSGSARILTIPKASGGSGYAMVHVVSGTFSDNDALTSSGGGTAQVDGVPVINGPVSTKPPQQGGKHVEEGSTAAFQDIERNYFNSAGNAAAMPALFLSEFNDVNVRHNNFNSNSTLKGALMHFQQDNTRNASLGSPPQGFRERDNFFHAGHLISVSFGDPATGSGANCKDIRLGPPRTAVTRALLEARYKFVGKAGAMRFEGTSIISDDIVDLRGLELLRYNRIDLIDKDYAGVKVDSLFRGIVYAPSESAPLIDTSALSSAINYMVIEWTDIGARTLPPPSPRSISAGRLSAIRALHIIDTEGASAADDLTHVDLPTGVQASGMRITLRPVTGSRVVTVKNGSGIWTPSDIVLGNSLTSVTLEGVSGSGANCVWRVVSKIV